MFRVVASLAALATAAAQPGQQSQWYGLAPDSNVPGIINIFKMTPLGQITAPVATVVTRDNEYPKPSTLHVSWNAPIAYFATGVGAPYTQDAIYAVNITSGQVIFRHELPANIYIDNLSFDYINERLFSVAFRVTPQGVNGAIAEWNATNAAVVSITDISADLRGGFVYGGAVSICPTTKTIFVGVDAATELDDFVLGYSYSAAGAPKLFGGRALHTPIPSSIRAVCNATDLIGLYAVTVQADSEDRETAMIGDLAFPADRALEGYFVPLVKGDLPTYSQRGEVAYFLNGLYTFHGGVAVAPVYQPFQRGVPVNGALWTVDFNNARYPAEVITPLGYYLAGAAGVPVA